jgi:hypothetical protein
MTDKPKISKGEILPPLPESGLPPLPAPSAWQHAPHDKPREEDEREVFRSELPPDLLFTPVPRRAKRSNGLNAERQRAFIAALATCGNVRTACKAIGCSNHAMWELRSAAGAESFSAAWDNATGRGARRVLDVMMDNALNGTPEYLYQNGQLVAERRRFNTRAQMWIVAHYMPERFGVEGGLMHSSASAAKMKRLKAEWHKEWQEEQQRRYPSEEETNAELLKRLKVLHKRKQRSTWIEYLDSPEKMAAVDLLHGPIDWEEVRRNAERLSAEERRGLMERGG